MSFIRGDYYVSFLVDTIVNKEARRLYAELKSLTHLISDEIMMSLYGISEIMMS